MILVSCGALNGREIVYALEAESDRLLPTSSVRSINCRRTRAHGRKNTSGQPAMAASALVDAGFLVALLSRRVAVSQATQPDHVRR
jgi:hypothetical protein